MLPSSAGMHWLLWIVCSSVFAAICEEKVIGRVVMPKMSLTEMIRLSRLSKRLHGHYKHVLEEQYMTTVNDHRLFDLGALYREYKGLESEEDGIGLIEFITSVFEQYRREAELNYWALAALEYTEYAFFKLQDELDGPPVWSIEFSSFFNELFRTKRFRTPLEPIPAMIFGSDIYALLPHLRDITLDELAVLLMCAQPVPRRTWTALVQKVTGELPKYLSLLRDHPLVTEKVYRKDLSVMDVPSFCLFSRIINEANRIVCMRLLNLTTVAQYDRSWYYYMIIMRAPYTVVRYCFKQRPRTLGAEFIDRAVLAVACSGFEHRMYQYLRYRPEHSLQEYAAAGKQVVLKGISPRDAVEACLILGASDEACYQVMRVRGFKHDTQLLLLSILKGRSDEFVKHLMATEHDGQYMMLFFSIPFPNDRKFYFPFRTTFELARTILLIVDDPDEFVLYAISLLPDIEWQQMLQYALGAEMLSDESLKILSKNIQIEKLPEFCIHILPYCVKHGFDIPLGSNHPIVQAEIRKQITSVVKQLPYLTLYGWWRSLKLEYPASSLLNWTSTIVSALKPI